MHLRPRISAMRTNADVRNGVPMTQQQTDVPPAVHPSTELRPLEHFAGRTAVGLAAVVAAATGFGVLLVLVRLHWAPLERIDRGIAAGLNNLFADRPLA